MSSLSSRKRSRNMGTVKAGYLNKLGGFFNNSWNRRYFVLYQDGVFSYYQDSKDKECDGKIHMKTECRKINVGYAVGEGVKPPEDGDIKAMFCVSSPERTWYLYAETESDAREWIALLEQARVPLTFGDPQNPLVGSVYPSYGVPNTAGYGMASNPAAYAYGAVPGGGAYAPSVGFNPSVIQGAASSGPPPPYSQGPPLYASGYTPSAYPQPYARQHPSYPAQPPGAYAQQAPGPYYTTPAQYPQQPQTVYVQQPPQQHSGHNQNMMMGAAAGAVGGATMGYMLGHTVGGIGHHGLGHHGLGHHGLGHHGLGHHGLGHHGLGHHDLGHHDLGHHGLGHHGLGHHGLGHHGFGHHGFGHHGFGHH